MKRPLFTKVLALSFLIVGSLIEGYALIHHSRSSIPALDFYTYKVDKASNFEEGAKQAMKKHKAYAKGLGVPDKVINIFDKVTGFTSPIATALGPATGEISVLIQEGAELGVKVTKKLNELIPQDLKSKIIGGIMHDKDDDIWKNVPRGNRGRFAEKHSQSLVYAIPAIPGTLVPIRDKAFRIPTNGRMGFIIDTTQTTDPDTGKVVTLYTARATEGLGEQEYKSKESDTRDQGKIRELAKISGARALVGK